MMAGYQAHDHYQEIFYSHSLYFLFPVHFLKEIFNIFILILVFGPLFTFF
jgi:hypothetical protein